jgi:hypothetical protein
VKTSRRISLTKGSKRSICCSWKSWKINIFNTKFKEEF